MRPPRPAGCCTSTRSGSSRPWRAQAGLEALQADQVKRLRLAACPDAAAAILPRALRLLRRGSRGRSCWSRRTPRCARPCSTAALDVGVWTAAAGGEEDPAIVEAVLVREPLAVAIAADHPLARLDWLDEEMLAATPRLGGPQSGVTRARARSRWPRRGRATRWCPPWEPLPAGIVLRPLVGAAEWELRAGAPLDEVLSMGTLAAIDALRRVSAAGRGLTSQASGHAVGAQ